MSKENLSHEEFASWWERQGRHFDPDEKGVPRMENRRALAEAAFLAAMAIGGNYVCDQAESPTRAWFANGREVMAIGGTLEVLPRGG